MNMTRHNYGSTWKKPNGIAFVVILVEFLRVIKCILKSQAF